MVTPDPVRRLTPDDIAVLLQETSRTFALAVPLLSGRTRTSVGLAYLLFRCADTLEDASAWSIDARRAALETYASMLDEGGVCDRSVVDGWLARSPSTNAGYTRLLAMLPDVLAEVSRLGPGAASAIRSHTRRTALGMREMVGACAEGLSSIEALRRYCYVVAGIVGELLTTLFVQDAPALEAVRGELVAEERGFGEGLQLVNILKDEVADRAEGRSFLPAGASRGDVLELAAEDLRAARRYIAALRRGGAPQSFIAFTSFPCELAEETLEALRVQGPGAKIPRARVVASLERHYGLSRRPPQVPPQGGGTFHQED
jgi:farnesyl-diphosphate farnesyltransferase